MFKVFILKHTHTNAVFNVSKLFLSKLGGSIFIFLKGTSQKQQESGMGFSRQAGLDPRAIWQSPGAGGLSADWKGKRSLATFVLVLCTHVVFNKIFQNLALPRSSQCKLSLTAHTSALFLSPKVRHDPLTSIFCPGQPRTPTLKLGPSWGTSVSPAQMTHSVICQGLSMKNKVQNYRLCVHEKEPVAP